MYCCKYCSKQKTRRNQSAVLYEVLDEMEQKDNHSWDKFGDEYQESKLGSKLHRAFMAEIGEEMCQCEVAHHANRGPEYLCSRPEKYVHLYKQSLAVTLRKPSAATSSAKSSAAGHDGSPKEATGAEDAASVIMQRSDMALYENRGRYWFEEGAPISPNLSPKETPEEQVATVSLFDFFRLVKYHGGRQPWLSWHPSDARPIVVMSPIVKLTEGPDIAFNARWALVQYHPWTTRQEFLGLSDEEAKSKFRSWRLEPHCPWYIKAQYLSENGRRAQGGAGPMTESKQPTGQIAALPLSVYEARIVTLLANEDYKGAAILKARQECETNSADTAYQVEESILPEENAPWPNDEDDAESSADEQAWHTASEETHILKMLYQGNMEEVGRQEQQSKKAKLFMRKHDVYRNTKITSVAQEEQTALAAGVLNHYEDSDDDDAYTGEGQELTREMDELRVAKSWINQDGWNLAEEGRADCEATGRSIDLRLDWGEVRSKLAKGAGGENGDAAVTYASASISLDEFPLEQLDPTQRVFANRVLDWAKNLADTYDAV